MELEDLIGVIDQLYNGVPAEPSDQRAAGHAAALLWSGLGRLDVPLDAAQAVTRAIEIGYVTALRDVREGRTEL